MELYYLLAVGLAAGFVMATTAAGLGAIIVPMLLLHGVEPVCAIQTSLLIGFALPFLGSYLHWTSDPERLQIAQPLVFWGVLGSLTGSLLSPHMPPALLKFAIGLSTALVGMLLLIFKRDPTFLSGYVARDRGYLMGIGLVAGFFAGAFGTGWGPIGVSLLVCAGIAPHMVIGSSLVARIAISLAASISYAVQTKNFSGHLFAPLLFSGFTGTFLGVKACGRLSPERLRNVIGTSIMLLGISTMAQIKF